MEKICTKCKVNQPIENFGRKHTENRWTSHCKKCLSLSKAGFSYNRKSSRAKKFKRQCVEFKGSCCVVCGYKKNDAALEFHHVDPAKKEFLITKFKNRSFDKHKDFIVSELNKCLLVCVNCHREIHLAMTVGAISNQTDIAHPRTCPKCKVTKDISQFHKPQKNGIKQCYCKTCNHQNTLDRQKKFKQDCVNYKGGCCEVCGYRKTLNALEFHHLRDKDPNFSKWRFTSFEKNREFITSELDKCRLLCGNCHREEHQKDK